MAKKKKQDDDINEELGDDSNDINEVDDNFGLPDVDLNPLDESDDDSDVSEEPQEEKVPEHKEVYKEASYKQEPTESTYEVPKGESIAPKLITFAILLIISAGAIWYFAFYKPKQVAAEKARIEQQNKAAAQEAARKKAEQERLAQEQVERDRLAREAEEAAKVPEVGVMTAISSRTGRYYVVIGSFIDDDLAADYANKLGKEGNSTSLIAPYGNRKFYRLAITDLDSFDAAQAKADELKPTFGEGLWVLKY